MVENRRYLCMFHDDLSDKETYINELTSRYQPIPCCDVCRELGWAIEIAWSYEICTPDAEIEVKLEAEE